MFKEDTLFELTTNWFKYKPEDELYYKLEANPFYPFRQIGYGYYYVVVQSDRYFKVIINHRSLIYSDTKFSILKNGLQQSGIREVVFTGDYYSLYRHQLRHWHLFLASIFLPDLFLLLFLDTVRSSYVEGVDNFKGTKIKITNII